MPIETIYTVQEVADALRIDARTVRKLINAEALKGWFRVGRQIRITESGLKGIIESLPPQEDSIPS